MQNLLSDNRRESVTNEGEVPAIDRGNHTEEVGLDESCLDPGKEMKIV
jgi:hypothetical protein